MARRLFTSGVQSRRYLEFQLDAYFDQPYDSKSARCPAATAAEILDASFESVGMVVICLRRSL